MMLIPLSFFGASKHAVRLAVEAEVTHAHGRALGLTPDVVDGIIRERSAAAASTPYPLDWRAVRAAVTNAASTTTEGAPS